MPSALPRRSLLTACLAAGMFPTIAMRRAAAQDRAIHVGVYNSAQGVFIKREIIPRFEADFRCRVFTTEGATLTNIAALRATRGNPRFTVMSMDDVGVPQAKAEGLIERLEPGEIPNLEKVYPRFLFEDNHGVGFAVSSCSLFHNPRAVQQIASYGDIWEPRFRRRFLMNTPKNTQSVLLLIVAAALATGKPLQEAQYVLEEGWGRLSDLKSNVLTIYDSEAAVMQVAQGQADVGGLEYSKAIVPHTVRRVPLVMATPREGSFTGINGLTLVKGGPERELGCAFINRILEPSVSQIVNEATFCAATVRGIDFRPEVAPHIAYPESKMQDMGLFTPDWKHIIPRRPAILERYNQVFGG